VRAGGNRVALRSPTGRKLATFDGTLRVTGDAPLRLNGLAGNGVRSGRYRGALEFRAGLFSGVSAINAIGLEDYVRGVVSAESPAAWPAAALEAQAVVARSYAITTDAGSAATASPPTRTRARRCTAASRPSTRRPSPRSARLAARSSRTAASRSSPTSSPRAAARQRTSRTRSSARCRGRGCAGVNDPFDSVSPRHRWGPVPHALAQAGAKLGGLVKGHFRSIKVLERGSRRGSCARRSSGPADARA
jgi:stage II sporulation protein D